MEFLENSITKIFDSYSPSRNRLPWYTVILWNIIYIFIYLKILIYSCDGKAELSNFFLNSYWFLTFEQ